MRILRMLFLFLFAAVSLRAQQQSVSLPMFNPIVCTPSLTGYVTGCSFITHTGTAVVIVLGAYDAVTGTSTLTDSQGNAISFDVASCTPYDDGLCAYHFQMAQSNVWETIQCQPHQCFAMTVLMYAGTWDFVTGNSGTYATENAQLGAQNGGNYDANWTEPIEAQAGDMLIGYSFSNTPCCGTPKPGMGFQMESSTGQFAIEDMLAPVSGVYIGTLTWKRADGYDTGGSHWIMGLACYRRRVQ